MTAPALEGYLSGRWSRGEGVETTLVDPVTGDALATASAKGLDLAAALAFARREGQGALRGMGYAARAKLVGDGHGAVRVPGQRQRHHQEPAHGGRSAGPSARRWAWRHRFT